MSKDIPSHHKLFLLIFSAIFFFFQASAQEVTFQKDSLDKKKLRQYVIFSSVAYGGGLIALDQIWYSGHDRESFHFFNDNREWKQIDKLGHFYTAYQLSHLGIKALRHTGVRKGKAYFWGGMSGLMALTPIEVLDGFSAEYGASWGDIIANVSGSALVTGQYMLWDELRIHVKYSYTPNSIAQQRPDVLGNGFHEEMIKNYNGMTYWLSFDLYRLLGEESHFPKWLNIAVGYGGEGMISGSDAASKALGYDPYRQYYVALDLDLTHIPTNSKFVKALLYFVNMIHLPSPALEYNRKGGLVFHPLYF